MRSRRAWDTFRIPHEKCVLLTFRFFHKSVRERFCQSKRVLLLFLLVPLCVLAQTVADGIAAVESGRAAEAVPILSEFVRTHPDSADGNLYLGLAYFRSGNASLAKPLLLRATELSPKDVRAWKMLGLVIASIDPADAVMPLAKACELGPRDEEACYYLGRTLSTLGRYESARGAFEKALRIAPSESKVQRAIALNFAAMGMAAEAETHFRLAIQAKKQMAGEDPRVDYGAFLFRQGRVSDALAPLQMALRDAPGSARANLELGRVLLHLEKLQDAASYLEKATSIEPTNANAHLLLGRVYLRLGRNAEGEREMELGQPKAPQP
jgi:Flp pilus assembly protein TadD